MRITGLLCLLALLWAGVSAQASQAYGSLNNFDAVNDTGQPCHGFDIEIEDVHSREITYTYDYNHYGTPTITEDNSNPVHPRVLIRYESKKNPDGSWAAYTAVPSGPVSPTDGHQFTNPNINFGGEHFGVGFYGIPGAVRYYWLVDDGFGGLTRGNLVSIGTPSFSYVPPAVNAPAQVQAVIAPPPPPVQPAKEFGEPSWVKVTSTQTHNNNRVELRDLVSDDPDDPDDENWKNGEPDEVEVEWQLLQVEFNKVDGGNNGFLENAAQELPEGDEIITVRYDFFEYSGPIDAETGEALCDKVGPDDLHGEGIKEKDGVVIDFSTIEVVGAYVGAQMAGFDAEGQIGLIDHLQDGELYVPYVERSMVIGGTAPIVTTLTGDLPQGMAFDEIEGVLSGTPETSGLFSFTIHSVDAAGGDVTKDYSLKIVGDVVIDEPPVVEIVAPVDGDTVRNTVTIEASAVDDIEVSTVIFTVDGVYLWETAVPYLMDWDTTTVADGAHVLEAYAYDSSGQEAISAPVTVVVDNATPVISSEPPVLEQEVGFVYKYNVTATGIPAPRFTLVTSPEGMTLGRSTGALRWRPTGAQLGTHEVTISAFNKYGADEQTWTITVVDTRRPTVPKDLVATEVTSTSIALAWTESTDKGGVAGYRLWEYYRNSSVDLGWRIAQDNLPATSTVVTGLAPKTTKKYRVTAFDASGNESSRSAMLTVTTLP
ncbi:MAG: fibronectin type III domain-containing protein [Candidatus Hydrogenedentes bacterium]|nr:fibronectin type III domain-containing protein [Candidatus Hydrogenedentota bacterium]